MSSLAVAILALGVVSCGDDGEGGSRSSVADTTQTATAPAKPKPSADAKGKGSGDKAASDTSPARSASGASAGGDKPSGKVYGDGSIQGFGENASDGESSAAIAAAEAYYAARAAGTWKVACGLMASGLSQQLARSFGQGAKPSAKAPGCPAILAGLAGSVPEPLRKQEADTIEFTDVRVKDTGAFAIFESKAIPHGFLPMAREDGEWKVAAIAGSSL